MANEITLTAKPVSGQLLPDTQVLALEGTAQGLDAEYLGPNPDWTWSRTAENPQGELTTVPLAEVLYGDLDATPGLTYVGESIPSLSLSAANIDPAAALNAAPEASDSFTLAWFINNDLLGIADEGWVSEMDTATPEFNADAYVTAVKNGDVIRLCWLAAEGNEDDAYVAFPAGGEIVIS